jgi:hypothetical protein
VFGGCRSSSHQLFGETCRSCRLASTVSPHLCHSSASLSQFRILSTVQSRQILTHTHNLVSVIDALIPTRTGSFTPLSDYRSAAAGASHLALSRTCRKNKCCSRGTVAPSRHGRRRFTIYGFRKFRTASPWMIACADMTSRSGCVLGNDRLFRSRPLGPEWRPRRIGRVRGRFHLTFVEPGDVDRYEP